MEDKGETNKKLCEAIIALHEFYMKNEKRQDEQNKHTHDIENLQGLDPKAMVDKLHELAFRINPAAKKKAAAESGSRVLLSEDFHAVVESMNIHDLSTNPFCLIRLDENEKAFDKYYSAFEKAISGTLRSHDMAFRLNNTEILVILKCPLENAGISMGRLQETFKKIWNNDMGVEAHFDYGASSGNKVQMELFRQGATNIDKIIQVILNDAETNLELAAVSNHFTEDYHL